MSYSKSRARTEFEAKHSKLLTHARQISFSRINLSYEHKNMIYQSSIVLLCASLEEYLRVFIEDMLYRYKIKGAPLSKIPETLRTYSLLLKQESIYKNYINNGEEVKTLERLKLSNNSLYEIFEDSRIFKDQIYPKTIYDKKKYPSPRNIQILYNRIGVKNLFNETNRIGRKDYELMLRSFLDVRENIAHQVSMDLTFTDIKRHFENIKDFLDKLDRITYKHICDTSGQRFWK